METNSLGVKRCTKCDTDKDAKKDFAKKYDGKSTVCKECHRGYAKNHYLKNSRKYREKRLVYNAKIAEVVATYMMEAKSGPCADCKVPYPPYVMDFDHVRGKKDANVSAMVAQRCTLERIKAEVAKCDLVCGNCHRERTHQRLLARSSTGRALS